MTHSTRALLLAPSLLVAALLAGCGDETAGGADPGTDPTASPDQGETCGGISTDQLAEWTGTEQVLRISEESGDRADCETEGDATQMVVSWSLRPVTGSYEVEGEDAQLNGLDRVEVELAGGIPAWQLQGNISGTRIASVVTVLDGGERTLTVQADDEADRDATVTEKQLDDVVVRIAETVAGELGA